MASAPTKPIGIFALSSPFARERFETGLQILRELGFEPILAPDAFATDGYLAGSDERRLRGFEALLEHSDLDLLMAARGGYGIHRLLDRFDYARQADRTIVGFSDVTALQLARWTLVGAPSIHGPVVTQLVDLNETDRLALRSALTGEPAGPIEGRPIVGGTADGVLLGGCLALVVGLLGTPYLRSTEPVILLLEDVGEAPFRLDRMLTQLELSDLRPQIAGVAVGAWTDCERRRPHEPDGSEVAEERLRRWGVPVVRDLPIGHGRRNHALWVGRRYRLDGDAGRLAPLP